MHVLYMSKLKKKKRNQQVQPIFAEIRQDVWIVDKIKKRFISKKECLQMAKNGKQHSITSLL